MTLREIGFGCTVPAVMSTITLPSERDRKMTILLTPFMSCSAKLPIYAFFVSAFFPGKGGLIMAGLYLLGDWRVCTSLISGFLAKESVVSTLEILYGGGITAAISPVAAASLLIDIIC